MLKKTYDTIYYIYNTFYKKVWLMKLDFKKYLNKRYHIVVKIKDALASYFLNFITSSSTSL